MGARVDRPFAGRNHRTEHGLPAGTAYNNVSLCELREIRGNHFTDRAALHHIPDANRFGVGRRIAHSAAHVRVEREP